MVNPSKVEKYLNVLKAIKDDIDQKKMTPLSIIIKNHKVNDCVSIILKREKIITHIDTKGNKKVYEWSGILPNIHMATKLADSVSLYDKQAKKRLANKDKPDNTQSSEINLHHKDVDYLRAMRQIKHAIESDSKETLSNIAKNNKVSTHLVKSLKEKGFIINDGPGSYKWISRAPNMDIAKIINEDCRRYNSEASLKSKNLKNNMDQTDSLAPDVSSPPTPAQSDTEEPIVVFSLSKDSETLVPINAKPKKVKNPIIKITCPPAIPGEQIEVVFSIGGKEYSVNQSWD